LATRCCAWPVRDPRWSSVVPMSDREPAPAATADPEATGSGFAVHLDCFEGPFDLLLSLIAKRRLDVTLVALSQVTDEFIAHIRAAGDSFDLDQASEFVVVAATLLDLKVARLLPAADVEDEEDLALLEARDLLFARLLQYRAYRSIAEWLKQRWEAQAGSWPRSVGLEPAYAELVPPVVLGVTPEGFAAVYQRALQPRPVPMVDVSHLHAPTVSVHEQAVIMSQRLRAARAATFRHLVADAGTTVVVVARFLALLELYREGRVQFDQLEPLGELRIRWTGPAGADPAEIEVDDYSGAPSPTAERGSERPVGSRGAP
jgi:segregation and condensation protein A